MKDKRMDDDDVEKEKEDEENYFSWVFHSALKVMEDKEENIDLHEAKHKENDVKEKQGLDKE